MDAYDAIVTRRSVRNFTDEKLGDEAVDKILEAAMLAPSAVNKQPWSFVVIDDRAILDDVPTVHPHAAFAKEAPIAILVCGERNAAHLPPYMDQDCSAATENILLAAHALGYGGVWCGVYPDETRVEGFRRLCRIPADVTPFALVVIGRPAKPSVGKVDRFDREKIHRNVW